MAEIGDVEIVKIEDESIKILLNKFRLASTIFYGSISSFLMVLQKMKLDVYGLTGDQTTPFATKLIENVPSDLLNHIGNANIPTAMTFELTAGLVGYDIFGKLLIFGLEASGISSDNVRKLNSFIRNAVSYSLITALVIGNCDAETLQVLPYQLIDKLVKLFIEVPTGATIIRPGTADLADLVAGFVGILTAALWLDIVNSSHNLSDKLVVNVAHRIKSAFIGSRVL